MITLIGCAIMYLEVSNYPHTHTHTHLLSHPQCMGLLNPLNAVVHKKTIYVGMRHSNRATTAANVTKGLVVSFTIDPHVKHLRALRLRPP